MSVRIVTGRFDLRFSVFVSFLVQDKGVRDGVGFGHPIREVFRLGCMVRAYLVRHEI
jgi:hypothetical protein